MKWTQVLVIVAVLVVGFVGISALIEEENEGIGEQIEEGAEEFGDEIDDAT